MNHIVFVLVFVLDQTIKFYLARELSLGELYGQIPGFVEIVLQHNTGMAFSLMDKNPVFMKILTSILVLLLTFIAFRVPKSRRLLSLAFAFILGGAYSNLLDRYLYGFVIDYINLLFVDFAVFNLADISLNVGACLLLIDLFTKEPSSSC